MSWNILKQERKPAKGTAPPKRRTASKLDSSYIEAAAKRGCASCPLDKADLETPKIPPTGSDKPAVYIVGEAPGKEEDEQGEQFVGKSGQLLRRQIPEKWEKKIRWNNTIRCRPPANREPALLELACCRKQQEEDIARSKPKIILGFGNVPLTWMLGGGNKISVWRGRLVPVSIRGHHCWYMPMLHPSYILRSQYQNKAEATEELFRRDISQAFEYLDNRLEPPVVEDPKEKDKDVVLLTKFSRIMEALEIAKTWEFYGIDLETNGIRPYTADAKILTCAISNYEQTFAFPLRHRQAAWKRNELRDVEASLRSLLLSGGKPIAHNSKFEQEWLSFFFGPGVVHEVDWQDTMAQAYVLDERAGAKGLENVSVLMLGMNVKNLRTRSGRIVNVKKLDDEQLEDVLDYNAYDSKYVYPIYHIQAERLEAEGLTGVYEMMNTRAGPFALAQQAGVQPDTRVASLFHKEYEGKITKIERAIQKEKDVVAYVKKTDKPFLSTSPKALLNLLHHELGFKECIVSTDKRSGKTKLSTGEEVLKQIDHPLSKLILELRGYSKLDSTYIVPLLEGGKHIWEDGLIHTSYNHLLTSTGRTSSEEPNLQNFPYRTDEARRIREVLVAEKDKWLVAFDYGQIEARVIAMASKCPVLTKALWEGYDIHGEWTQRIADAYPQRIGGKKMLHDKAALKAFRERVKNLWTFPLFYGSVLDSVAKGLEVPAKVLSPLYDEFWEMFDAVHEWQEKLRKFYRKHGYVEALTYRRRHGPLSQNEIVNTPVQGTASDIVVDASIRLSRMAYEQENPALQWRLNVHDDLSFYISDKSLEDDIQLIGKTMVTPTFGFINVPLVVEVAVGKNWGEMEEVAKISSADFGHTRGAV